MFSSRLPSCVAVWAVFVIVAGLWFAESPSVPKLALVIGAVVTLLTELIGSRVTRTHVSFPWRPLPGLPLVALWRTRVPMGDVQHLTGVSPQLGFERVKLSTKDMRSETLLFGSRAQKVAFFSTISGLVPSLSIYRDKSVG